MVCQWTESGHWFGIVFGVVMGKGVFEDKGDLVNR